MLDVNPDEPCWGQVELVSRGDDEYGWPISGHLCEGHAGAYEWHATEEVRRYRPEPETEDD